MAVQDMIVKISADATTFTSEAKKVEKATKSLNQAAQEAGKKTLEVEKLTLTQKREAAREEARLGREAQKVFDSTRTAAERYQKQVAELKKHLSEGRISQDTFNRSMKDAEKGLKGNDSVTSGYVNSLKAMVHPAALAAVGVAAIGKALKESHDAFKYFETASKSLTLTMSNLGQSSTGLTDSLKEIRGSSTTTMTEVTKAYSTLVLASGDVGQSEKDLKTAFDMSAKAGVDLATATGALTAARQGSVGGLQELNLLTAQEVALLGQINDPATRAATAIKIVGDRSKNASIEMTEYEKSMARTKQQSEALALSAGETTDYVAKKASQAWGVFTTGASVLSVVAGSTLGIISGPKTQQDLQDTSDKYAGMSDEVRKLNEEFDRLHGDSKSKFTVGKKTAAQEIQEVLDLQREHLKQEKALLDAQIQAGLNKQSAIRQKQLDFDLKMLKETDELKREQIRLEKEEFTITESIKNEDEQKLAIQLAQEQSAQRQLEIRRKETAATREQIKAEYEKEKAKADAEFYKAGPSDDVFAFRAKSLEALKTPLDHHNEQMRLLNQTYQAGLFTQDEYNAVLKKTQGEFDKLHQQGAYAFNGLAQIATTAGSSMFDGLSDALFDPMNFSFEDMANNAIEQIGRIALEMLSLQALKAAGGSAEGGGWAGLISGLLSGAPAFAEGGPVFGPGTGTSDSILARLSNGEFVIPARSTSYYGLDYLEDLRKMKVPKHRRYAEGGLVTRSGSQPTGGVQTTNNTTSQTHLNIVNVTPESASDYLSSRAGEKTILNILSKNAKSIKTILN